MKSDKIDLGRKEQLERMKKPEVVERNVPARFPLGAPVSDSVSKNVSRIFLIVFDLQRRINGGQSQARIAQNH